MRMLLLSTVLLAGTLCAQPASYTYIDQPPPYSNSVVPTDLTALNAPRIGQVFQVQIPGAFDWMGHRWNSYLATGLSNPTLDLGPIGFPFYLFTSAESVVATSVGAHGHLVTFSFSIPNSSALLGSSFYQQVFQVAHLPFGDGVGLGRGGHGVIGT